MEVDRTAREPGDRRPDRARGRVAIFGLGTGRAASACALRPEATAVTVAERDEDVLDLHRDPAVFGRLPDRARDKVRIAHGNAHEWTGAGVSTIARYAAMAGRDTDACGIRETAEAMALLLTCLPVRTMPLSSGP